MSETCEAKIRPMPNDTEIQCGLAAVPHDEHKGELRDYAWPGSSTTITWMEGDRRTFRGGWAPCSGPRPDVNCTLPARHHGSCAP